MKTREGSSIKVPARLVWVVALGLYLTLEGYHSRDGDQAYRLPLLARYQDPSAFANDPFVNAVDQFNPHRGYLALLDVSSRPLGLSAGLFGLFAVMFGVACVGFARLARALRPDQGPIVGVVAVGLLLAAKSGNLGDNPLFEPILLDRLIAFSLGWLAFAIAIEGKNSRVSALLLGAATLIHPSLGLQLAMLLASGWFAWAIASRTTGVARVEAASAILACALCQIPALIFHARLFRSDLMFGEASRAEYLLIAASIQSPQHMLPRLWRLSQGIAWGCMVGLGFLTLWKRRTFAGARLASLLGVLTVGLGFAWLAIDGLESARATLFQPFRLATVARGFALAAIAGRVVELWGRGGFSNRARALVLCAAWSGDLAAIVATGFEAGMTIADANKRAWMRSVAWGILGFGVVWLSRRDTASGHVPLSAALGVAFVVAWFGKAKRLSWSWTRRRLAIALIAAWILPVSGALATVALKVSSAARHPVLIALATRWRFGETPKDDIERLAVWCRSHLEASARFATPPGPKTFRLWSRRAVAFNRAGSPYHAAGLIDWADRFRRHVRFDGSLDEFAHAYLTDRHALERRYDDQTDRALAALAIRERSLYLISHRLDRGAPLERLHVEGRYAVYRVRRDQIATGADFSPSENVR